MLTLFINNKKVIVPTGTSVLEACKQVGIDIPRFCYHESLSVAGNCRMCLVEIEKSPKPIAACAMPVSNNMAIFTDTPLVKKARENVLEIMLLNHPLDCPICDQGGECDLQDQTKLFGGDYSRFFVIKRSVEDKNFGPLIKTIMTRCIHCTRCVRFATEVAGIDTIGTLKRGENTEIGAYIDRLFGSEISGNVIDLCPVGALTSKPYAFTARPWELRKISSVDPLDSVGSNIQINFKETEIARILPKYAHDINNEWISDKIRFSYDSNKRLRIVKNYVKIENKFKAKTLNELYLLLKKEEKKKFLVPIQGNIDVKTLTILNFLKNFKNIRVKALQSENVVGLPLKQNLLIDIAKSDACVLIGTNIKIEAPIIQIRLREQFLKGNFLNASIGIPSKNTISTSFLNLTFNALTDLFNGKLMLQQVLSFCKWPFFFIGKNLNSKTDVLINYIMQINKNAAFLSVNNSPNTKALSFLHFNLMNNADVLWADSILSLNLEENTFIKKIFNKKNIIAASTHGSKWIEKANLIIALFTFFEQELSFINLEGRLQKTNKIYSNSNLLKTSQIPTFFLKKKKINKSNLFEETKLIFTPENNKNKFMLFKKINNNKKIFSNYPFKSNVEDYYLTNKFVKSSSIMGQCSQTMRSQTTNFL